MITVTDRNHLPGPPQQVWAWFAGIERHYREWHPAHIEWRTLQGSPVAAGSTIFFDERIGRFRLAMRCRIAEVVPGRFFRYEGTLPYSLVRAGGSFAIEPAAEGCDLIAEVHMGWRVPVLGPLIDRLIVLAFPLADLRLHMAEEGRNLAVLLAAP